MQHQSKTARPAISFLQGYLPLSALWEGDEAPYPSEASARWAIRRLRRELAEASAIALHRGRTLVHLERLKCLVEQDALTKARHRYCGR